MAEDTLINIQKSVADRLMSDEYFADVKVVVERIGNIDADINQALGLLIGAQGKIGVCVVVRQITAADRMREVSQGPMSANITVSVWENVLINSAQGGTGKYALSVARRVLRVLKQFRHQGYGWCLVPAQDAITPNPDDEPYGYSVRFTVPEADSDVVTKITPVGISNTGPVVTLTCPDATEIWYTLDGSYPSKQNTLGNAAQYSAPFTLEQDSKVQACGYAPGCIPSDVARKDITV